MTTVMNHTVESAPSRPLPAPGTRLRVRILVTLVGLVGAGVVVYGVRTPWLSTYGGLLSQSGWGTRNGMILFWVAVAAAALAVAQLLRSSTVLRWLLALTGFGAAGFAGYLLIQLYSVTQQLDGMTFASKGDGLYLCAAGGAVVFATIFLPLPVTQTEPADTTDTDDTTPARSRRPLPALLRPLSSRLRFPTAALGLTAALAHVPVTPSHLAEAHYIGVGFIVFTTVAILASTALLIGDSAAVWGVLGASCLAAAIAYVVSRTVGLPLMGDDVGNWGEPLGVVSVVTEAAVVVLAAITSARARRTRR